MKFSDYVAVQQFYTERYFAQQPGVV